MAAPSRQMAAPTSEATPTVRAGSPRRESAPPRVSGTRSPTPWSRPCRPAAVAVRMVAIAVPPAPRASMASAGRSDHWPFERRGRARAAPSVSAPRRARATPREWRRCAAVKAAPRSARTPYDTSAATIKPTPNALLDPPIAGSAMTTAPPKPISRPASVPRPGRRCARTLATAATQSGVAPFNMPVSAEETCCSANGNMLSGNANHSTPSAAVAAQSARATGCRADREQGQRHKADRDAGERHPVGRRRLEAFGDEQERRAPDHARHHQQRPIRERALHGATLAPGND